MAARTTTSSRDNETLGTVARAAVILRSLAEADEDVSIKALSDQLSLAPSTVHRLLHLLMDQAWSSVAKAATAIMPGPSSSAWVPWW
jgi:DNA-binding IclR family transcriptional regulator